MVHRRLMPLARTEKEKKMEKIDCTKAEDYLTTRAIATQLDENGYCRIHCDECIIKRSELTCRCEVVEYLYPEIAIKLMQEYADEHLNAK